MKSILLLFIATLSVNVCVSQTIIENPSFNKTTHKDLKIEKITIGDDETIIDFFIYADEGWFCVDSTYYIKGVTDEKTYKLLRSEGMSICPQSYEFNHDSVRFSLHFQPIDTVNNYIDIIEGCDNSCVRIENVLINRGFAKVNDAYNKANNYYNQNNYTRAIETAGNGLKLIQDTNGLRYGQLSLIIGDSYLKLKDYSNAEIWYQRILNSDLGDSTETGNFAFPFANFKNKACQGMAYVYEYRGNWAKSLEWLEKEKNYPFYTYGNTHRLKHAVHILEWHVFLYEKMERYDKAIYENLTFVINHFGSGVREQLYMRANQRLVILVASHYDSSKFISQLDSALESMIITENEDVVTSEFYFLNQKYEIKVGKSQKDFKTDKDFRIITGLENKEKDKEYFINKVKSQLFYDRVHLVNGQSLSRNGELIYYKDKPYTGKFYEFWVNGNIRTEGELREGIFNGDFAFYYESGVLKEIGSMIEGSYHGLWKTYYDNGAIESEGVYNHGKRIDKWTFWYPSGKQNMPLNFTEGYLAGFSMTAQSDEDIPIQKKAEINYTNDVENGLITIWFESGQKFREGSYEQGVRIGKWLEWNEDGNIVKRAKYKDGNLIKGDSFEIK